MHPRTILHADIDHSLFNCGLCNVQTNGPSCWNGHLISKKHRASLKVSRGYLRILPNPFHPLFRHLPALFLPQAPSLHHPFFPQPPSPFPAPHTTRSSLTLPTLPPPSSCAIKQGHGLIASTFLPFAPAKPNTSSGGGAAASKTSASGGGGGSGANSVNASSAPSEAGAGASGPGKSGKICPFFMKVRRAVLCACVLIMEL